MGSSVNFLVLVAFSLFVMACSKKENNPDPQPGALPPEAQAEKYLLAPPPSQLPDDSSGPEVLHFMPGDEFPEFLLYIQNEIKRKTEAGWTDDLTSTNSVIPTQSHSALRTRNLAPSVSPMLVEIQSKCNFKRGVDYCAPGMVCADFSTRLHLCIIALGYGNQTRQIGFTCAMKNDPTYPVPPPVTDYNSCMSSSAHTWCNSNSAADQTLRESCCRQSKFCGIQSNRITCVDQPRISCPTATSQIGSHAVVVIRERCANDPTKYCYSQMESQSQNPAESVRCTWRDGDPGVNPGDPYAPPPSCIDNGTFAWFCDQRPELRHCYQANTSPKPCNRNPSTFYNDGKRLWFVNGRTDEPWFQVPAGSPPGTKSWCEHLRLEGCGTCAAPIPFWYELQMTKNTDLGGTIVSGPTTVFLPELTKTRAESPPNNPRFPPPALCNYEMKANANVVNAWSFERWLACAGQANGPSCEKIMYSYNDAAGSAIQKSASAKFACSLSPCTLSSRLPSDGKVLPNDCIDLDLQSTPAECAVTTTIDGASVSLDTTGAASHQKCFSSYSSPQSVTLVANTLDRENKSRSCESTVSLSTFHECSANTDGSCSWKNAAATGGVLCDSAAPNTCCVEPSTTFDREWPQANGGQGQCIKKCALPQSCSMTASVPTGGALPGDTVTYTITAEPSTCPFDVKVAHGRGPTQSNGEYAVSAYTSIGTLGPTGTATVMRTVSAADYFETLAGVTPGTWRPQARIEGADGYTTCNVSHPVKIHHACSGVSTAVDIVDGTQDGCSFVDAATSGGTPCAVAAPGSCCVADAPNGREWPLGTSCKRRPDTGTTTCVCDLFKANSMTQTTTTHAYMGSCPIGHSFQMIMTGTVSCGTQSRFVDTATPGSFISQAFYGTSNSCQSTRYIYLDCHAP